MKKYEQHSKCSLLSYFLIFTQKEFSHNLIKIPQNEDKFLTQANFIFINFDDRTAGVWLKLFSRKVGINIAY